MTVKYSFNQQTFLPDQSQKSKQTKTNCRPHFKVHLK